jgi:hypothetical protein
LISKDATNPVPPITQAVFFLVWDAMLDEKIWIISEFFLARLNMNLI